MAKRYLYILVILFIGFVSAEALNAQTYYGTTDLKIFREGRDKDFRDKEKSPLKEVDFPNFEGLEYFPTDEKYCLTAKFIRTTDEKYFLMPTTSGKAKKYIKYAEAEFTLDDAVYTLNVYQAEPAVREANPEYKDLLFIPFKDLTNGRESYAGGRYMYIMNTDDDEVILDFNLASNPSCAYGSTRFSCPIPPRDNYLKVEIRAGEKSYESGERSAVSSKP